MASSVASDAAKALDNASIANDLKLQAQRMAAEAKGLLAESDRLLREATALTGDSATDAQPARRRARSSKRASAWCRSMKNGCDHGKLSLIK